MSVFDPENEFDVNLWEEGVKRVDNSRTSESGSLDSVFSPGFSSSPRSAMYQAWVYPEMHPKERQAVLKNWSDEDIEMFCGTRKEIA